MVILSNALSDRPDEGSLKVASCLAGRIKAADPGVTVISYERHTSLSEVHLKPNKLLLDPSLIRLLRQRQEPVLYLPFPTRALPMAARIFVLSLVSPTKVIAVLSLTRQHGWLSWMLLKSSRAHLVAISRKSYDFYREIVGSHRVTYLKTGVDTRKFRPVSPERSAALKARYGLDPEKPVLLHVGHLKEGRNVGKLLDADPDWQILLVVSTLTEQDEALRKTLEQRKTIKIIDRYLPDMEELYQLADVYFFPVTAENNCIDVPLSCLEAAACGVPVVTTAYGEMGELAGKPGFFFVDEKMEDLNERLRQALTCGREGIRGSVLPYDWENGAKTLREKLR